VLKHHAKRASWAAITAVALAITVAACGSSSTPTSNAANTTPKKLTDVTVVTGLPFIGVNNANVYIGDPLGYYKAEGLKVTFQPLDRGGSGVIPLVKSGGADIVYPSMDGYLSAIGEAKGAADGLVAVFQPQVESIYDTFLVMNNSPIKDWSDLKGKTVGVNKNQASSFSFPAAALKSKGMSKDDVKYLAVGTGPAAATALKKGRIDALALWDSEVLGIEALGFDVRELSHVKVPTVGTSVITTQSYLKSNRTVLAGLGRAMAKSILFANANPEAAIKLYHAMFPQVVAAAKSPDAAFKTDVSIAKVAWPKYHEDASGVIGMADAATYQAHGESLGYNGVDFSKYFTNDLVKDINDFDHQAIVDAAKNYGK
jgi:NitT/TauT family transport system substrate-binding protein